MQSDLGPDRQRSGHGVGGLSIRGLDTYPVIHRGADSLQAAEVPLRGLDRDVSEEKLDLFQTRAINGIWFFGS
jgi:hypothetical protein